MANIKATLTHHDVFNNKKIFSDKIHRRVLKVSEEISKSLDDFKIANDEEKRLFLNAVNHYYHDLCAVIFHLRQVVIKIDEDDQGVRDLENVIAELNKIVLRVQEFLNMETGKLMVQLKGTIVEVGTQVEKLMEIIKFDNLHEHKQKVLDCQHDLVISAEALKLYCQFSTINPSQLENIVHEAFEKIRNNLIIAKESHAHLSDDFSHYTRHSIQNLQNSANYMRKIMNTQHLQTHMATGFKCIDVLSIEFLQDFLEASRSANPMSQMLEILENSHKIIAKGSAEIQKGLQIAMELNTGKKEHEKEKQLMIHMYINTINALSSLNQSIEDAILQK